MNIAIPQLNYFAGNVQKNYEIILHAIQKAKTQKADLILFPELAICGSFPQDLLEKEYFIEECRLAIDKLAGECGTMAAVIGAPNLDSHSGIMYNSAYFIQNGEVTDGVHKTILCDYDVYEESRYFVAGEENTSIRYKNKNIRILFDEYESEFIEKNDDIIVFIGNIPFTTESLNYKQQAFSSIAKGCSKSVISISRSGANTSVVFDGNSMVYNPKGQEVIRLKEFEEDFHIVNINQIASLPPVKAVQQKNIATIHKALIAALKDYFYKNNFQKALLGLSGGIDSALVAALVTEAIGKENVMGVLMPSEFSTDHSVKDAEDLAKNLGIAYEIIPIKNIYDQYLGSLAPLFKDLPFNVAEENLQARSRGALLFAISNKFGHIVLNTSNKSETAVGYGTLYGDLCGSLSVISDIYKTEVYELSRYMNRNGIIIPENTITKAPSAELRPGQKDQDSLPDYDVLDKILKLYIEENLSEKSIINKGFDKETVHRILSLVDRNEYKRAQCAPTIKVSKKAFRCGRKMPF
ncbi:NAD+ synthase [Porphyromonadaceae bacterium OttesenSCG-928-L07]|nr:NAD+ synthase [Porphyromonadaceae bacterium OttesenSCG-928-L07]MDL2252081.1 NAD+ synthase [Odoribacter sp. OttesenSCG-928-J03]MDL2330828.1 NAD+ synthase [Odoribacter sp. OttesenSCG-928-A06]